MRIKFYWNPKLSFWEIREMFGLYTFRVLGTILQVEKWWGTGIFWWRISFTHNGEENTWFTEQEDLFLTFDMVELYYNETFL